MPVVSVDPYTQMSTSASHDQSAKGQAHHAYFARTMGRNANYLVAHRGMTIIGSGNDADDDGTATPTIDAYAIQTAASVRLRQRGTGLIFPRPLGSASTVTLRFYGAIAKIISAGDPKIQIVVSPNPLSGSWPQITALLSPVLTIVPSSTTLTQQTAFTTIPFSYPSGLIHYYMGLREVALVSSWSLYLEPQFSA